MTSIILSLLAAWLVYIISLLYHRLYLSPISKFPGPKLAAATFWYEFYYDIILGGGYIWKIKSLHEQYGPVIRINPGELHVNDPDFWDVLYTASTNSNRRDKWSWQAKGVGIPASTFGTESHALHRHRRGALNPFFSRQNVMKLVPVVEERVKALVQRFKALGEQGEIVSLEYAFSAFTNDVVMQYCFNRMDYHIEAPGFDPVFHNTSFTAGKMIGLMRHMNWILTIMRLLPESLAVKLGEEVSAPIRLKRERIDQIEAIRRQDSSPLPSSTLLTTYTPDVGTKTILHTLLTSALPPDEKTTPRLAEEAVLLVGAATHTTSWVLTVLTYHLLAQPALLAHLKAELATVSRNPETELYRLEDLEKLPFLTAVIKEGLRLGYGIAGRSARIAQDVSLRCGEWITPPGTPVSMTIPLTHHNEALFPDSHRFDPERWLTPTSRNLEKYLVAFSKGSRSCVGINLAWAELYLCTAGVVGSFGTEGDEGVMELWETDERDVRLDRDLFFPVARVGSKGVRVRISSP